jgi:PAS domain S-box-containing protein
MPPSRRLFPVSYHWSAIFLSLLTAISAAALALYVVRRKKMRLGQPPGEELQLSDRFRSIAENLPIVLVLANADLSKFLYVNRAYEQIWGRTAESLYENSLSFLEIVHPDDRERLEAALAGLVKGEPIVDLECRLVRPDGSIVWIACRGYPVRNERGEIHQLTGSAQDITERKRAENALRESEDRYRDLVEHSSDLICTHDALGMLLSVNEAPLRILGYSREELMSKPLREFVAPEAKAMCDAYLVKVQKEGFASGLLPMLTKSGEVRLWEYNNSLRKECMSSPIVRGIAHDVTEQRRAEAALRLSEEKFSKAFRSSPVEIVISTVEEGRLVDVNESFQRTVGFTREELIGRTTLELGLVNPDERMAVMEEIKKNGHVTNREIQIRAKSGEIRTKLCSAELIRIGGEGCLLAVSQDITARKHADAALRRLSGQLLQLHDEERRSISRDLHDVTGQDLVALSTLLDQARTTIPTTNRRLRRMFSQSQALADRCIREVRTLSYVLHPPMLDEAGLEDAIRHYAEGFAERTGIHVELDISTAFGRVSPEIELAVFRVVQESLCNIHRHSGGFNAAIRLHRKRQMIFLEVSDDGRGIPKNGGNGAGIFQLKSGVGVPSMRERVNQVAGQMDMESSSRGTTVRVTVPLHE